MITTKQIQQKLAELGFDPGPIDNIPGRKTTAALQLFQKSRRLQITGTADTPTVRALFGSSAPAGDPSPPWMDIAKKKLALHETRDNSALREFLKLGKGTIGDPSKTPWCGDFVETCVAVALVREPVLDNPYAAINWLKFGVATTARYGAILVFHRGDPKSWEGHVGFYVGEDATHYHVLGGNQSNAVTISRIAKTRLRPNGIRWPTTFQEVGGPVFADGTKLITTTNEA